MICFLDILKIHYINNSHKFVFHIDDNGIGGPLLFNITDHGILLLDDVWSTINFRPDITSNSHQLKIIGVDLVC